MALEDEIRTAFDKPLGSVTFIKVFSTYDPSQELITLEIVALDEGYAVYRFYWIDYWGKHRREIWQCEDFDDIFTYVYRMQLEDHETRFYKDELI